jgi:hypothetical protein
VSDLFRRPNAGSHGTAAEGPVIINPTGPRHRVLSETGCIVLTIIYEKPVRFIGAS